MKRPGGLETVYVSAGRRGLQIELAPGDPAALAGGTLEAIGRCVCVLQTVRGFEEHAVDARQDAQGLLEKELRGLRFERR